MDNIKDIITAIEPSAVLSDAGDGMFCIPIRSFRNVAEKLRNGHGFDFLRSLTGMDWGEEGLGCVYHLENTSTGENVVIKTADPDRDNASIPTVSDLWKGAQFNEREAYDFYGIKFTGNPDLRRLYLRDDWKGYPLRKDYDMSSNPLNMENEDDVQDAPEYELTKDGSFILKRKPLFEDEEYVINIGPCANRSHISRLLPSPTGWTISGHPRTGTPCACA